MTQTACQDLPKRGRGRPAIDPEQAARIGLPGLRAALASCGVTQARLAAVLNTSQTVVSSWCCGSHDPPSRTVRRIAATLGVTADALLAVPTLAA